MLLRRLFTALGWAAEISSGCAALRDVLLSAFLSLFLQGKGNLTSPSSPDNKTIMGNGVRVVLLAVLCLSLLPRCFWTYLNSLPCPQTKCGTQHPCKGLVTFTWWSMDESMQNIGWAGEPGSLTEASRKFQQSHLEKVLVFQGSSGINIPLALYSKQTLSSAGQTCR